MELLFFEYVVPDLCLFLNQTKGVVMGEQHDQCKKLLVKPRKELIEFLKKMK